MSIRIKFPNRDLFIACIYRPCRLEAFTILMRLSFVKYSPIFQVIQILFWEMISTSIYSIPSNCHKFLSPNNPSTKFSLLDQIWFKFSFNILLKVSCVISPLFWHIFNRSMELDFYPNVVNPARVISSFKTGDANSVAN
jgi:hypothetical protein